MNRSLVNTSLVASLLAALAVGPAAQAQAPTKAAPAAATPAPAPAPVAITPEMRAAIKDLMDTTKTRDGLVQTLQQMAQGVRPQMGQIMAQRIEINPSLSADQKQQVRASMEQPFEAAVADGQKMITDPKVVDDAVERMTQIYARTFTVDEIRQITTFYKSPTGQKAIGAIPNVVREAMQGTMTALVPKLTALADNTVSKQTDAVLKGGAKPAAKSAPAPAAPKK